MIPFFFAVFGLCVVFFFFPLGFFPSLPTSSLRKGSRSRNGNLRVSHQPSEPKQFTVDGVFFPKCKYFFPDYSAVGILLGRGVGGIVFFSSRKT